MEQPLVTAILCTYNRESYLREALDSILAQTYPHIEILVVDDGSTNEGMFRILEEYAGRITLIRRPKNSGTCELPRYEGVEKAHGKYCAFLDSDDLWAPDKIRKQVAFMDSHPEIGLCHTYVNVIDGEGKALKIRHEGGLPPTGNCGKALLEHCFISISSIMVRPRVWLDAVDRKDIIHLGMEWDILLRAAMKHDFGLIPEVCAAYRRSPEGVTTSNWKWTPRDVGAMERIWKSGVWSHFATRAEMRRIMQAAYLENALHHHAAGHHLYCAYFVRGGLRHGCFNMPLYAVLLKTLVKSVIGKGRVNAR